MQNLLNHQISMIINTRHPFGTFWNINKGTDRIKFLHSHIFMVLFFLSLSTKDHSYMKFKYPVGNLPDGAIKFTNYFICGKFDMVNGLFRTIIIKLIFELMLISYLIKYSTIEFINQIDGCVTHTKIMFGRGKNVSFN